MAIWAIKGYEELYEGLHGVVEYEIFEGTFLEAKEVGREMSRSVINSYPDVYEQLEDDVEDQFDYYKYDCEDDNEAEAVKDYIRNDIYLQDMAWETYELNQDKLPTKDRNILIRMFQNDEDKFLKKYAIN